MRIRKAEPEEPEYIVDEFWLPLAREIEEINSHNDLAEDVREKAIRHRNETLIQDNRTTFLMEDDGEPV
ncbi:MAG: GNAT family N-acetyltransferase, partial [Candidatus Aenigmatarchaeota archaeon]